MLVWVLINTSRLSNAATTRVACTSSLDFAPAWGVRISVDRSRRCCDDTRITSPEVDASGGPPKPARRPNFTKEIGYQREGISASPTMMPVARLRAHRESFFVCPANVEAPGMPPAVGDSRERRRRKRPAKTGAFPRQGGSGNQTCSGERHPGGRHGSGPPLFSCRAAPRLVRRYGSRVR